MKKLTQERLLEALLYDSETGVFRWRNACKGTKANAIAGCLQTGGGSGRYRRWQIVVDRVHYKAHHLAWLYVYGKWPTRLDHINRDATDNRIVNLREASEAENHSNSVYPKGATGYRGVSFYKNRYMAQISHNGKSLYIGRFLTAEEAHLAWCHKASELRGEFVRAD